jgi:hypothetical protein
LRLNIHKVKQVHIECQAACEGQRVGRGGQGR